MEEVEFKNPPRRLRIETFRKFPFIRYPRRLRGMSLNTPSTTQADLFGKANK